jgi:hypothetical protein
MIHPFAMPFLVFAEYCNVMARFWNQFVQETPEGCNVIPLARGRPPRI